MFAEGRKGRMKGKTLLCLAFVTSMLLGTAMISPVGAQSTTFGVEPPSIVDLLPGSTVTVEIWIRNVTDLQILEFHLGYNTTVLNATSIAYGGIFGDTYFLWGSEIWDDLGWLAYSISPPLPVTPFNGSGRAAIINFTVDSLGDSALDLYETALRDSDGQLIDHETIDGSVVVIPEFPPSMIMPLFLIITLAVILGKMIGSRRGRGPSIAM